MYVEAVVVEAEGVVMEEDPTAPLQLNRNPEINPNLTRRVIFIVMGVIAGVTIARIDQI